MEGEARNGDKAIADRNNELNRNTKKDSLLESF